MRSSPSPSTAAKSWEMTTTFRPKAIWRTRAHSFCGHRNHVSLEPEKQLGSLSKVCTDIKDKRSRFDQATVEPPRFLFLGRPSPDGLRGSPVQEWPIDSPISDVVHSLIPCPPAVDPSSLKAGSPNEKTAATESVLAERNTTTSPPAPGTCSPNGCGSPIARSSLPPLASATDSFDPVLSARVFPNNSLPKSTLSGAEELPPGNVCDRLRRRMRPQKTRGGKG